MNILVWRWCQPTEKVNRLSKWHANKKIHWFWMDSPKDTRSTTQSSEKRLFTHSKNESSPGRSMNWPHITQHAAYKATSPNQIITKSTMLLRSSNQKVYNHCVVLHIWLYDSMKKCYSCYLLHVLPVSYHNNGAQQNTHSSFGINNNVRHSHVTAIILCSISNTIHKHPTAYLLASIYADHYLYLSQWKDCMTEAPRSP